MSVSIARGGLASSSTTSFSSSSFSCCCDASPLLRLSSSTPRPSNQVVSLSRECLKGSIAAGHQRNLRAPFHSRRPLLLPPRKDGRLESHLTLVVRAEQIGAPSTAAPTVTSPKSAPSESAAFGVFRLAYETEKDILPTTWKKPVRVVVTGASGQIANHFLFKLAAGDVLGKDQPLAISLLSTPKSVSALEGVAMEMEDSLFPLLREVKVNGVAEDAFRDADWAVLIGAKPRGPGMERSDLLDLNGQIFAAQGRALNEAASPNVKVIVIGNPCNTNALICMANAPNIPRKNFHALTTLDENRAKCQLALKAGVFYSSVTNVCIWGNHSTTQVPDFLNAKIAGRPAMEVINDEEWLRNEFTPLVQKRGATLIQKWGRSSAASTAVAVVDLMKKLTTPTLPGEFFSSAVCSDDNPYGIEDGLIFSLPLQSKGDGDYQVIGSLEIDDYLWGRLKVTVDELVAERNCVLHLMGIPGGVCEINDREDTTMPGEV